MAKVKASTDLQNVSQASLGRYLTQFLKELLTQVNGGLEFNLNLKSSSLLTFNFLTANTDLTVIHDLGRIPKGFIVTNSSVAMSIYQGSGAWSSKSICLRSNAVGVASIYAI